jgi:hypothetical protein
MRRLMVESPNLENIWIMFKKRLSGSLPKHIKNPHYSQKGTDNNAGKNYVKK